MVYLRWREGGMFGETLDIGIGPLFLLPLLLLPLLLDRRQKLAGSRVNIQQILSFDDFQYFVVVKDGVLPPCKTFTIFNYEKSGKMFSQRLGSSGD